MSTTQETKTKRTRHTRRWVQREAPLAWWPWAFLPLLAFIVLVIIGAAYLAPRVIEPQVQTSASERLAAAGFQWAQVEADGQEVWIRGNSPAPVAEDAILQAAQGTDCSTAFGRLSCPTTVHVDVKYVPVEAKPAPPASQPAAVRHHDFVVAVTGDGVRLQGEVPAVDTKTSFVASASALHSGEVIDELTVSKEIGHVADGLAQGRAVAVLELLESGTATWKDGSLSVEGVVAEAAETEARAMFSRSADAPSLGGIKLSVVRAEDQCEQDLAAVLKRSKIQFETGSAVISVLSQDVLDALAAVALDCPGTLLVEGHTDGAGSARSNSRLSQRRAQSVVAALVKLSIPKSRLEARGLGEERPIAGNDSSQGRAQNRRIEIHVNKEPEEEER